jgi:hypothetical protein
MGADQSTWHRIGQPGTCAVNQGLVWPCSTGARDINGFDGALRIAAQVSFADALLADWMEFISGTMHKVALHEEADHSPQMIDDIAFGFRYRCHVCTEIGGGSGAR